MSCTDGVAWLLAGRDECSGSIHVSVLVCCRQYDLVSSFVLGLRDIFGFTVFILDFAWFAVPNLLGRLHSVLGGCLGVDCGLGGVNLAHCYLVVLYELKRLFGLV